MSEKALITGISGFIGYELAEKLLKAGYEVGGLVRQHPQDNEAIKALRGRAWLFDGDITDSTRLKNIIREYNPQYVIHLAALTRVSYSFGHEEETMETNLGGTIKLVNAVRKYGTNLKKFIYASSMEAYGHQTIREPFNEQTSLGVGSPYGVWKIAGDYFIRQQHYANDFPALCLRQTNTYGRRFDDYFVVETFITSMLKNKDVVNFGNPEPFRNFMHIDDLTDLYLTLLKSDNKELLGKSFTVGPPNAISIRDLAELIAKKLNWKGKINWYTREIRDGEIYYLNSTNDYITSLTGWKPKISLDEGLDRTIAYWKEKLKK